MNEIINPPRAGDGSLLSKHFERLTAQRGGFGSWKLQLFELSPRWQWMCHLHFYKKMATEDFPQTVFNDDRNQRAFKFVESLLQPFQNIFLDDLLKFLLHRFGHTGYEKLPANIHDKHIAHWESLFDLEKVLDFECDLFGDYYGYEITKGLRDKSGYFPTPQNVCNMMVEMTMTNAELTASVNDPCVGSGRMLLSASNKALFLSGNDINPVCVRMTLVNGYLFAPQIVAPPPQEIKRSKSIIPIDVLQKLRKDLHGNTTASF